MNYCFKRAAKLVLLFTFSIACASFIKLSTETINDFSLKNIDNKIVSTNDYKSAKGFIVIFTCNHCPFAKLYSSRINNLNTKYSALNVPLLAINSMDTLIYQDESFDKMKLKAKADKFNFPYLQDRDQKIGKNFGAEHTPTAFVIWKINNEWVVKYKGSIDDNGENASKAKPFIANAVDELLQNKPISNPLTESFGCKIFYRN